MADELMEAIPIAFASCSIGHTEDALSRKLDAIARAGFGAIELSWPDLVQFARTRSSATTEIDEKSYDALVETAPEVKEMVRERGLGVMMLQPFANFEGWPRDSKERADAFDRARGWIRVMRAVGTDLLQVGSTDSNGITGDRRDVVDDLRELAGMLDEHGFRLAYENWAWSTHAPTWEQVWDVVKEVDRANVGLCLDTFQTAASEYADPTTESGLIERGGAAPDDVKKAFEHSLDKLSKVVPKDKIYVLQISDAYRLAKPLADRPDASGLRPRGQWSHDFRPMPFEDGGYLPVVQVAAAVLRTGFRGWFSTEIFDGGRDGKGKEYDLDAFARRAKAAHVRLVRDCASALFHHE